MEAGAGAAPRRLTLDIRTTTGGAFALCADARTSVDHLKKMVSRRLKVPKERICLLHRERQLRDGTLEDNGLIDGSRVILLPSVETGLLTQRPENSVMQALESLNDSQVNDFLSGKSPLNLTMRLGDHMMLIQLQLSTYPGGGGGGGAGGAVGSSSGTKSRDSNAPQRTPVKNVHSASKIAEPAVKSPKPSIVLNRISNESKVCNSDINNMPSTSTDSSARPNETSTETKMPSLSDVKSADNFKSFLCKQDIETLQNAFEIFKSLAEMQEDIDKESGDAPDDTDKKNKNETAKYAYDEETNAMDGSDFEEQSPIKSLSNLVSGPMNSITPSYSTLSVSNDDPSTSQMEEKPKYVPLPSSLKNNLISSLVGDQEENPKSSTSFNCPVITDPIAANLTSCLCSTFDSSYVCDSHCHPSSPKTRNPNNDLIDNCKNVSNFAENVPDDCNMNSAIVKSDKFDYKNTDSFGEAEPIASCSKVNNSNMIIEKNDRCLASGSSSSSQTSKSFKNKRLHYLLHKTSRPGNQTIQNKPKAFMQSLVNKHIKKRLQQGGNCSENKCIDFNHASTSTSESVPNSYITSNHFDSLDEPSTSMNAIDDADSSPFAESLLAASKLDPNSLLSDSSSLVEASKNLTQTLKKLSKEVLTSKVDLTSEETCRPKIGQGAVIESMKHHGKGIYSGTFSGTLNPALQDRFGRPKRDISTIIHILNDLLCATPPQYRRGARITFEPTHNGQPVTRTRQRDFKHSSSNCTADQGSDECDCTRCSNNLNMCPYGECNGHYSSPVPATDGSGTSSDVYASKRTDCGGNALSTEPCTCSSDKSSIPQMSHASYMHQKSCPICSKSLELNEKLRKGPPKKCKKCNTASTLALDNSKTKCKLDQLRLVMQQKKQRREARKIKSAPYPTTTTSSVVITQSDSSNILAEEIETVA